MNYDQVHDVCQDVLVHDDDEPEDLETAVSVVLPGVIPGRCTRVVVVVVWWCSLPTVSHSDCVWLYTDIRVSVIISK